MLRCMSGSSLQSVHQISPYKHIWKLDEETKTQSPFGNSIWGPVATGTPCSLF